MNVQNATTFNLERFLEVRKAAQQRLENSTSTGSVDFNKVVEQLKAAKLRNQETAPATTGIKRPVAPHMPIRPAAAAGSDASLLSVYSVKRAQSTGETGGTDAVQKTRHLGTLFDRVA